MHDTFAKEYFHNDLRQVREVTSTLFRRFLALFSSAAKPYGSVPKLFVTDGTLQCPEVEPNYYEW